MTRRIALAAALGLAAVAVLHAVWAASPWPFDTRARYAEVVVGVRDDQAPGPALTLAVALLLAVAAVVVLVRAGVLPRRGPAWVASVGTWVVAGVLLLRGVAGLVTSATGWVDAPDDYRTMDVAVYSPLCLLLGAGVLTVAARTAQTPRATTRRAAAR